MFSQRFLDKDRRIQERWFRIKAHKMFGRHLKAFYMWRLHRKLEREFNEKSKVIASSIQSTVKEFQSVDQELFPATKELFNIGLYVLLAERDIQALKADAFAHPNEAKRNIALRALLLTIYELDIGKVAGRKMQFVYESTGMSEDVKSMLVRSLKSFNKARKVIKDEVSEARHNTIAHREANALRQYEIISELRIMAFSRSLTDFYKATDQLLKSLVAAMLEVGTMKSMLHQATYTKKQH